MNVMNHASGIDGIGHRDISAAVLTQEKAVVEDRVRTSSKKFNGRRHYQIPAGHAARVFFLPDLR